MDRRGSELANAGSVAGRPQPPALLCPSAQPDMPQAEVLGVLTGGEGPARLSYLEERLPASEEILALADGVSATRVLRFAAQCEEKSCRHFDGANCQLARRIVDGFDTAVERPPPCRIRQDCRWFAQEGRAACLRCPQIVTEIEEPSEKLVAVALG